MKELFKQFIDRVVSSYRFLLILLVALCPAASMAAVPGATDSQVPQASATVAVTLQPSASASAIPNASVAPSTFPSNPVASASASASSSPQATATNQPPASASSSPAASASASASPSALPSSSPPVPPSDPEIDRPTEEERNLEITYLDINFGPGTVAFSPVDGDGFPLSGASVTFCKVVGPNEQEQCLSSVTHPVIEVTVFLIPDLSDGAEWVMAMGGVEGFAPVFIRFDGDLTPPPEQTLIAVKPSELTVVRNIPRGVEFTVEDLTNPGYTATISSTLELYTVDGTLFLDPYNFGSGAFPPDQSGGPAWIGNSQTGESGSISSGGQMYGAFSDPQTGDPLFFKLGEIVYEIPISADIQNPATMTAWVSNQSGSFDEIGPLALVGQNFQIPVSASNFPDLPTSTDSGPPPINGTFANADRYPAPGQEACIYVSVPDNSGCDPASNPVLNFSVTPDGGTLQALNPFGVTIPGLQNSEVVLPGPQNSGIINFPAGPITGDLPSGVCINGASTLPADAAAAGNEDRNAARANCTLLGELTCGSCNSEPPTDDEPDNDDDSTVSDDFADAIEALEGLEPADVTSPEVLQIAADLEFVRTDLLRQQRALSGRQLRKVNNRLRWAIRKLEGRMPSLIEDRDNPDNRRRDERKFKRKIKKLIRKVLRRVSSAMEIFIQQNSLS